MGVGVGGNVVWGDRILGLNAGVVATMALSICVAILGCDEMEVQGSRGWVELAGSIWGPSRERGTYHSRSSFRCVCDQPPPPLNDPIRSKQCSALFCCAKLSYRPDCISW